MHAPTGNGLIVDFEATCSNINEFPREQNEIIEFPGIVVGPDLNVVAEFSSFVRPIRNPVLTDFCRELTTIRQAEVDTAPTFPEVAAAVAEFVAQYDVQWWGSWGDYDRNQLTKDVQFHRVPNPLPQPHINLKQAFSDAQGVRRLGLGGAVRRAELTFQGTAHRGIDDSCNIVALLPWVFGDRRIR
ncbi:3'-5' exonuclease [Leifsonia sp. Leaf264]|uniref:3'-5' exonuclease n=1 Tax=Leifsonia sp. Leaf264 TaxID=1736314 RepID=UPI0006FB36E7|nr:3'-5' exonuclease [Leifsonia sp. Leaf264]KQO98284.1 hypothetical protein ASF30_09500 [Leifsonia sp. Leaf264]